MEKTKKAMIGVASGPDGLQKIYEAMCSDITENVGSTRASVWLFTTLNDAIVCQCLLDTRTGEFHSGAKLNEDDFHEYFDAIKRDANIVAPDAATHPATRCFEEVYFQPNDIHSLLDFIVADSAGTPLAVLCCEHCGDQKAWTPKDTAYLHQMASLLGMTFKFRSRVAA